MNKTETKDWNWSPPTSIHKRGSAFVVFFFALIFSSNKQFRFRLTSKPIKLLSNVSLNFIDLPHFCSLPQAMLLSFKYLGLVIIGPICETQNKLKAFATSLKAHYGIVADRAQTKQRNLTRFDEKNVSNLHINASLKRPSFIRFDWKITQRDFLEIHEKVIELFDKVFEK